MPSTSHNAIDSAGANPKRAPLPLAPRPATSIAIAMPWDSQPTTSATRMVFACRSVGSVAIAYAISATTLGKLIANAVAGVLSELGANDRIILRSVLSRPVRSATAAVPMASTLTERLSRLVKTMRGQARITEENVAEMLREVRMALL